MPNGGVPFFQGMVNQIKLQQQQGDTLRSVLMESLLKQKMKQQEQGQQLKMLQQFIEGGAPAIQQPARYTPQEFGQLPLQQIQQLIPKTGFMQGQGLPFRPTAGQVAPTAISPQAGIQGLAGPGQVVQRSMTFGPGGLSATFKPVEAPERKFRQQQLQLASGLRKEFNQAKAFKDFQTIDRSEKSMRQAYQMSISPNIKSRIASDQALGVLFQKMLDPTSVVRESEYARTPQGAALLNQMTAFLPRLQKGGLALENEDRKALYDIAQRLLIESKRTLNAHIDRYTEIANLYGVRPQLIFGNIKKFEVPSETPLATPQLSPQSQAQPLQIFSYEQIRE